MSYEIIRKSELSTTKWSGGTTTQLSIFPKETSYATRDFIFRISTAKVEEQTSEFTSLPGFSRVIMILEGEIKLHHQDMYSKRLKKFESDFFKGEWKTTAFGKVVDFNLMTSDKASGTVEGLFLEKNETKSIKTNKQVTGLYLFKGNLSIKNIDNTTLALNQGDFFLFIKEDIEFYPELNALEDCELIITKIDLH